MTKEDRLEKTTAMDAQYNEIIKTIDDMLEVQRNQDLDAYMHGMYNGMEYIRSIVASQEPVYINKDGTLDKEAVERNPERFI